jgi:hypothetical protein
MCSVISRLMAAITAAILLVSCGGSYHSGSANLPFAFSATLTGREQVPPVNSNAFATAVVTVDAEFGTLIASVIPTGTNDLAAHIHSGIPGVQGPIVIPLSRVGDNTVWTAGVAITEAQLVALRNGSMYVDVHTAAFPNGEIRGQLFEIYPSPGHVDRLWVVSPQSPLVREQLAQLQNIFDWFHDGGFSWITFGFGVGF